MPSDTNVLAGVIVVLLLALAWHEAAHAWTADRLGDPTARRLGRVSLNPLRHLDPWLSFVVPYVMYQITGFAIGGGKPVPIDPRNFPSEHRARNFMLVALAGPASNLFLAALWSLVFVVCVWTGAIEAAPAIVNPYRAASSVASIPSLLHEPEGLLGVWLWLAVYLNVLLAIFNLVPLPPLDGSRFVGWLLPRRLQAGWFRLDRIGFVLVLAFFFWGHGFELVSSVREPIFAAYAGASDWLIALDPLGKLH